MKSLFRKLFPSRIAPRGAGSASDTYVVLDGAANETILDGWRSPDVAEEQAAAFAPLLEDLRRGSPRRDFAVLAQAVAKTGMADPEIIEVGCGSGWNSEVLRRLLNRPVRYQGVDYSPAMIELARRCYPGTPFAVGDATALPFPDGACDILISGTVLMHVADYEGAIRESRRVTRRWCVFHTVPVIQSRATTLLQKRAYGQSTVVEVIFNESDLLRLIGEQGLAVREVVPSIPYDLKDVLGEPSVTKTFLCEVEA